MKIFIYLIFIMSFIVFVILGNLYYEYNHEKECTSEYIKKYIYPAEYRGIIKKKYKSNNHGELCFDISNEDTLISVPATSKPTNRTPFDGEFWTYAEVGDSISKDKNSYKAYVFKKENENIVSSNIFLIDCP